MNILNEVPQLINFTLISLGFWTSSRIYRCCWPRQISNRSC
jgi:hypothetical protein